MADSIPSPLGEHHEPHPKAHALTHDAEFQALVKRKNTISNVLTILMLVIYFGFVALLAWNPETFAGAVGRATLGIPVGIGIIIFAWILTGLYVRWANTKYDSMVAHLRERVERAEFDREETARIDAEQTAQEKQG
jgi:uncharacterized membrane protein (DUF485 family)